VRKLNYWKVVAFIGTVIFLVSVFLPFISVTELGTTATISLLDLYSALTQAGEQSAGNVSVPVGVYGILLTVILYPITVILGFVSVFRRTVALAAGIIGIICWIGAVIALSGLEALQYTGIGIYVGFAGAIILLIAYALKPQATAPQAPVAPAPPPPPPQ
jgi:hypothetical protein